MMVSRGLVIHVQRAFQALKISFITAFIMIFMLILPSANAEQIEHCVAVEKGTNKAVCDFSPNATQLIMTNNCSKVVYGKFCYEKPSNGWECITSEIYPDEEFFGFIACETNGNYIWDVCTKGGAKCGYSPEVPMQSVQCENGETKNFTVKSYAKGLYRLLVKNGSSITLRKYKDEETGGYVLKTEDIYKHVCQSKKPPEKSVISSLTESLRKDFQKDTKKAYQECLVNNKKLVCSRRFYPVKESTVIGVRG